ncbi:signal peptidase I [Streptomyces sp. NBC_00249]|uniref:signal peptidase I n=1 Tax=Streptomyces sp. NBC_00249 TaxID=2975690 RepID=UPI0022582B2C|nr:signal peptidase I [Streptomyces sp. NBC_00249]MCX5196405.1 signal peptidase I [Streptomyces sp. NBC_00249]
MAKNRRPGRGLRITALVLTLVGPALLAAAFAWCHHIAPNAYHVKRMGGDVMLPTYTQGDGIFFDGTPVTEAARGDVVLASPHWHPDQDEYSLFRVVAVGGDRITFTRGASRLVLNGRPLEEPYLLNRAVPATVPFDVTVPEGRVFLMGDNRNNSFDSSFNQDSEGHGTVALSAVWFKAVDTPVGYLVTGGIGIVGLLVTLPTGIGFWIAYAVVRRRARKAAVAAALPQVVGMTTVE